MFGLYKTCPIVNVEFHVNMLHQTASSESASVCSVTSCDWIYSFVYAITAIPHLSMYFSFPVLLEHYANSACVIMFIFRVSISATMTAIIAYTFKVSSRNIWWPFPWKHVMFVDAMRQDETRKCNPAMQTLAESEFLWWHPVVFGFRRTKKGRRLFHAFA